MLIVVSVLVLSGLIFVQTKLIKTASDIREDQFNQLVKNALQRVADQLDNYERVVARQSALTNQLQTGFFTSEKFNVFPKNSLGKSSISFGMKISENNQTSSFQEEFEVNIGDSGVVASNTQKFYGIESLVDFRKEQQMAREKFLKDLNWYQNYKVFLEERPIQERIDPAFLNEVLALAILETGIELDYKYAIKNSNLGKDKMIFGDADFDPGKRKVFPQPFFKNDLNGAKPNY